MLRDYVLGIEITKIGDFSTSNISMLLKNFDLIEGVDYLKYGGITLLNKKSNKMPKYISKYFTNSKLTDLSNYVPFPFLNELLEGNISSLKNKIQKVKIQNKQFVEIKDKKLKFLINNESLIKIVVNQDEVKGLVRDKLILGHIKLSSKKSLCWY